MKAPFTIALLTVLLATGFHCLPAQVPSQVIIVNGGTVDSTNKVKVAAWSLATGDYTVFDSFAAGYARSVFIWGRDAYVCADSVLARYNLDTYQREALAIIPGVRQVAVWNDKVLVTKGLGATADHVEVLFASNLSHSFTLPGITGNCEGVVVAGDTGYVANPISFANPTGNMVVVDLPGATVKRTMNLDTMGKFISNLYLHHSKVVSINLVKFNNPQWGFVSLYNLATATFTHHRVDMPVSQGAGIDNGILYANFGGNIGGFDLGSGLLVDSVVVPGTWAGMVVDSVNHRLYVTETDHISYGNLYTYDFNGLCLDTLEVGVSPEALAVDYNVAVGVSPISRGQDLIRAYPQPFGDILYIDTHLLKTPLQGISLYDLAGRKLLEQSAGGTSVHRLELSSLAPGPYLLKVETRDAVVMRKLTKAFH